MRAEVKLVWGYPWRKSGADPGRVPNRSRREMLAWHMQRAEVVDYSEAAFRRY